MRERESERERERAVPNFKGGSHLIVRTVDMWYIHVVCRRAYIFVFLPGEYIKCYKMNLCVCVCVRKCEKGSVLLCIAASTPPPPYTHTPSHVRVSQSWRWTSPLSCTDGFLSSRDHPCGDLSTGRGTCWTLRHWHSRSHHHGRPPSR